MQRLSGRLRVACVGKASKGEGDKEDRKKEGDSLLSRFSPSPPPSPFCTCHAGYKSTKGDRLQESIHRGPFFGEKRSRQMHLMEDNNFIIACDVKVTTCVVSCCHSSFSYTAVSRKVVAKSALHHPERYCGWFLVHCSSKKFERMTLEALDVCLRVLKESNKSRFDSYSARNSLLIISNITFRECRLHVFPTLEIAVF